MLCIELIIYFIDGTKLPPICIFKGKRIPRGEEIPSGVVVWFQQNGWMDSKLMLKYVDFLNNIRLNNRTPLVEIRSFDRNTFRQTFSRFGHVIRSYFGRY